MSATPADLKAWNSLRDEITALRTKVGRLASRYPLPTNLPDDVYACLDEACNWARSVEAELEEDLESQDLQDAGFVGVDGDFLPEVQYP